MNADRLAPWYRLVEYAAYGRSLERRRREYLAELADARQALVLGDGDGRFLSAFAQCSRQAKVDAVEASREMLRLAEQRLQRKFGSVPPRVKLHCADALSWPLPHAQYDLIVSHFFLDCLSEEECSVLVSRVSEAASAEACWVISEFRVPRRGFGRHWARFWIWLSYLFFRWTTGLETRRVPDYAAILVDHGFKLERERVSGAQLLVSQLWRRSRRS